MCEYVFLQWHVIRVSVYLFFSNNLLVEILPIASFKCGTNFIVCHCKAVIYRMMFQAKIWCVENRAAEKGDTCHVALSSPKYMIWTLIYRLIAIKWCTSHWYFYRGQIGHKKKRNPSYHIKRKLPPIWIMNFIFIQSYIFLNQPFTCLNIFV